MNQPADTLDAIWEHWVLHRSIDVQEANVMRDELATHLADADEDGTSTTEVVGADLRAFADEWADQVVDQRPFQQVGSGIQTALAACCGLTFAAVIGGWSFDITFRLIPTAIGVGLLSLGSLIIFSRRASRLRRSGVSGQVPHAAAIGAITAGLFLAWVLLGRYLQFGPEVTLPRPVAIILAAVGALFLVALPFGPLALSNLRRMIRTRE